MSSFTQQLHSFTPDNKNYDRLYKVSSMTEYLCDKSQHLYDPHFHFKCNIDEAMVPYKVYFSMKQYIPHKPTKGNLKLWMQADSHQWVCI